MKTYGGWLIAVGGVLLATNAVAQPAVQPAQQPARAATTQQKKADAEKLHGYDLLTEQERSAYHAQMRAAKTEQERERIRNEHRELVQRRASEQGVDVKGMAYGPGTGAGPGAGGGGPGKKGQ